MCYILWFVYGPCLPSNCRKMEINGTNCTVIHMSCIHLIHLDLALHPHSPLMNPSPTAQLGFTKTSKQNQSADENCLVQKRKTLPVANAKGYIFPHSLFTWESCFIARTFHEETVFYDEDKDLSRSLWGFNISRFAGNRLLCESYRVGKTELGMMLFLV